MQPSAPSKELGESLLDAALKGNAEDVKSLIKAGADIDLVSRYGETALFIATINGHVKIVNSLIVAGVDVDQSPNEGFLRGRTALESLAPIVFKNEGAQKERLAFLLDMGANIRPKFFDNDAISLNIKTFVKEYIKPENALKREENLLKNTNLQDAFKESILAGKPITFRDKVVDKALLNALKSITADDLGNASEENVIKLKKSGVYPLLKIMKDLDDEEIILATKYLGAVKAISDKAEAFRKPELSDNLTSKILMLALDPKEPPYGLGEKLTLKIINLVQALKEPTNQFSSNDLRPPFLEPALTYAPPPISNQRSAQAPINSSLVPPGEPYDTGPRPTEPDSTFAPPPNRPNPRNFKFPPNSVVTADLVFAYEVQQEKPGTIPSGPSGVNVTKAVTKTAGTNDSR